MFSITQHGTTKQRARLDLDGYSYVKDRIVNEKIYWRCIKYSSDQCRSRLHTCIANASILKPPSEHTCKVDATESEMRNFSEQIVDRALHTQETPEAIISHCYKGMS